MTTLGILWFVIMFVLIAGYFILDGFDLGVGVLYPFLTKSESEKKDLIWSIGPVWDGNEVWLITAGGVLFAAFAPAYATTFSGFYLAIMLVLFGLILRAVSIEYRAHAEDMTKLWDATFFVGSLLPALLFGVAIGNVLVGIPLDAHGDYTGTFIALLNPFSLMCGVVGLVHMLTQGASWIALKAPVNSELRNRAAALRKPLALVDVAVFALTSIVYLAFVAPGASYQVASMPLAIVCAVLFVGSGLAVALTCKKEDSSKDLPSQLLLSLGCVALVTLVAASLFPNIVPATDAALSLTIANCAATDVTLLPMTIIACIGVPLVLVYHFLVYRSFKGRLKGDY